MICVGFKLLHALFYLANKRFGRFEGRNIMLGYHDGGILRDDAAGLLGALLHYEASETAQVNVVSF